MTKPVYVVTSNGLKVLKRFYMSKCMFYKGVVYILSVVEGNAFWTTHQTEDIVNRRSEVYIPMFKQDHAIQLQHLYNQMKQEETEGVKAQKISIDDRTSESKFIIDQSSRLTPEDLQN